MRARAPRGHWRRPPPSLPAAIYLRRVAAGVGAWAGGGAACDVRVLPAPPVQLLGVYLSHVPRLGGGDGDLAAAANLVLRVWGGPDCRELLWDSQASGGGAPMTRAAAAVGAGLPPRPAADAGADADADADADAVRGAGVGSRLVRDAALAWAGSRFLPARAREAGALVLAGDFRVTLTRAGAKKHVAALWLHTAYLPVPLAAARPLATALPPRTAGAGVPVPPRGAVPSSAAARERAEATVWLGADVPGGVLGAGLPTLGALYAGAASHEDGLAPLRTAAAGDAAAATAAAAEGVAYFAKPSIDGLHRDKAHAKVPAEFALALRFCALDLPAEWAAVLEDEKAQPTTPPGMPSGLLYYRPT